MEMEKVLCVPASAVSKLEHGYNPSIAATLKFLLEVLSHGYFKPRAEVEEDENFLQVIPYVITTMDGGAGVLAYQRKGGGEKRLEGQVSIGVGGHINPEDNICKGGLSPSVFELAAHREVREELGLRIAAFTPVGLVYCPDNPVGRVHVGLVLLADFEASPEFTGEGIRIGSGLEIVGWYDPAGIATMKLESWSEAINSGSNLSDESQESCSLRGIPLCHPTCLAPMGTRLFLPSSCTAASRDVYTTNDYPTIAESSMSGLGSIMASLIAWPDL